ncbi:MAG TPA: hypothetical protein VFX86_01075 [Candidatus Saccharimonadales bacterium]|nr:hypothetical protein [Candidatus Saccharimonadales bacterium]
MTAPGEEAYADQIRHEIVEVASMGRVGDFMITGMDPSIAGDESPDVANLMAVYTTPEAEDPLLRRLDLPGPDLPQSTIDGLKESYAQSEGKRVPALHTEIARVISDSIAAACDEIKKTTAKEPVARTLGMLGIYTRDGKRPLPIKFLNIQFLMTLMAHLPEPTNTTEMPEESLRHIHASIAEHTTVPPFEQWKSSFQGVTARVMEQVGDIRVARAVSSMHFMLLPKEVSHPTLESKLF